MVTNGNVTLSTALPVTESLHELHRPCARSRRRPAAGPTPGGQARGRPLCPRRAWGPVPESGSFREWFPSRFLRNRGVSSFHVRAAGWALGGRWEGPLQCVCVWGGSLSLPCSACT